MINKEIIDYQIVWNSTWQKLEQEVKDLMREDWQPLGGVSLALYKDNDASLAQAMVKYEQK